MFPILTTKLSLPAKNFSVISQAMQISSLSAGIVSGVLLSLNMTSLSYADRIEYVDANFYDKTYIKEIWNNLDKTDVLLEKFNAKYKAIYNPWEDGQVDIKMLVKNIDNEPNADLLKKAFDMNWAYYYWLKNIKGYIYFGKYDKKYFRDQKWDAYIKLCKADDIKQGEIVVINLTRFDQGRQQRWRDHLKKYNIFSDDICTYPDWR